MDRQEIPYHPNRNKIKNILHALEHHEDVYLPDSTPMPSWLDGRNTPEIQNTVVFKNGNLDVKSYLDGQTDLIPPTPSLFNMSYCNYTFDPTAIGNATPFLDCLEEVFRGDSEAIRLLQQWFGYNMVPDTSHEKFMLMVGKPGAGKGTILGVLENVVGKQSVVGTTLADLGSPHGLTPLVGKLSCILGDTHTPRFDVAARSLENIKMITGRDEVSVNPKHAPIFTTRLPTRFTIAANDLPRFPDNAATLGRRLLLLDFPRSFQGEENPNLKDELTSEQVIQGVAIWALNGLCDLKRAGKFVTPKSSRQKLDEFEASNSPIPFFAQRYLDFNPDAAVPKADVRDAYEAARDDWPLPRIPDLTRAIKSVYPNIRTAKRGGRGNQVQCYVGIQIKPRGA